MSPHPQEAPGTEPGAGDPSLGHDQAPADPVPVESGPEDGNLAPADQGNHTGGAGPGGDDGSLDAAALAAQRDGYLDDLQRVTAEFANFRRQTERRNAEIVAQAASRLTAALLPVLDACEAAVSQGVEGMDAVHGQLLGVLAGEGLTVVGAVDEPFDPECHEAVLAEEADGEEAGSPTVVEVLRTGYAWRGRVLRAAMVRVRG